MVVGMVAIQARARLVALCLFIMGTCTAQQAPLFPSPLDPARDLKPLVHTPLPEEYIWTAGDITAQRPDHGKFPWRDQEKRITPHLFRARFTVASIPAHAELYIAGPREADVYLNGQRLAHFASDIDAPIGFRVFHTDAAALLKAGENQIAISAVRGRGIVTADGSLATQQLTYGEVLAVKMLAAPFGQQGPALLISDKSWQSTLAPEAETQSVTPAWSSTSVDDKQWQTVASLGPIESNRDFMQWSADAGMYAWPGYMGLTAPLGIFTLPPVAITHIYSGQAQLLYTETLTTASPSNNLTIDTPANVQRLTDSESPALLLDFGREVAGRILVESASDSDAVLSIAYGESELEALATGLTPSQRGGNYLGTNLLEVPAHGIARGPKSAFRYVRVRFLRGGEHMAFKSIRVEGIAYPVNYAGSFESSDPQLNRIWETSAYTAHLCMQDDLWDAPKRDRGRWAGDIDVEGRVISDVFGDSALLERTLAALAPADSKAVNGIPGYSALWLTSLASLYAHAGDLEYLRTQHDAILRVIGSMKIQLDTPGLYAARKGEWPFIDWSPGLFGPTPQAVFGTSLQYIRGLRAAAVMLTALGDNVNATMATVAAQHIMESALAAIDATSSHAGSPLGHSWQMAALGLQSGLFSSPEAKSAVWTNSLSHVKQDSPEDPVISPYFNLTVLDAMAQLGHQREALDWMRVYWGGMLAEGATSFWESYDLRWPKDTPHLSLQADGTSGFFVSMAHGWSSGPAAWLSEQVLGVRDPQDGFRTVIVAPHLLGLKWARGAVPTPHGSIRVSIVSESETQTIQFDIPSGVEQAAVLLEATRAGTPVLVDGNTIQTRTTASGETALPPFGTGKHTVVFTPAAP